MELCDIYDATGTRTGRTIMRGTQLPEGDYYLVTHVWIRNEVGEYLIQQRAPHLDIGAGMWATTAGQVSAGEESITAAVRETQEELGLKILPESLRQFQQLIMEKRIEHIWIAEVMQAALGTPKLNSEVTDWGWATKQKIQMMIERGEFYPYSYFEALPE